VHFAWGWFGVGSATSPFMSNAQNLQVMGLVTTVGDGSETPPDARTQAGDADPPTQRWIYWESRGGELTGVDPTGTTAYWRDRSPQEPVDTKGQVSAKNVSAGSTLNLWASWAPAYGWDDSGTAELWCYGSILYNP
jgi:hypothetical protein